MNDASQPSELRLFISSTFRDLHDEREYLVKRVFPEIRALCRERGVTFTEIDLRWGLTEEEAVHGRVVRACLEEIDRCRPHFIGIVGSRYGWVPEYHEIAMDPEIHSRYPWVEEAALAGQSILEIEFAQAVVQNDCPFASFYRREGEIDDEDGPRLDSLIERISPSRPVRRFTTPEELGRLVREDLTEVIERTWKAEDPILSARALEERNHSSFARSRRRAYIPIPEYLSAFTAWSSNPETPLVITGGSGMGKSALVAWLVDSWRRKQETPFVVEHYVGCTGTSGDHIGLIRRVIGAIHQRYGVEEDLPESAAELEEAFGAWLGRVGALPGFEGDRLLLAVDALDQLIPSSRHLAWLPTTMPENVLLVVSTRPGALLDRLDEREWHDLTMRPLEKREREAIVVRYLGEFHKGLPVSVVERIGDDPKGESPLFLRTLAEEMRLHGVHEEIGPTLDRYLGAENLDALFQFVLERMEEDYGREVVGPVLSSIAVSRAGLTESDIIGAAGITRADLSILLFALDYHLLRSNGRLDFFHGYLKRAVEKRYLEEEGTRRETLLRLVDWFDREVGLSEARGPEEIDPEGLLELLHALLQTERGDRLMTVLSHPMTMLVLFDGETGYELLQIWDQLGAAERGPEVCASAVTAAERDGYDRDLVVDLLIRAGRLLRALGAWPVAEEYFRRAGEESGRSDDPERRDEALGNLGDLLLLRGDYAGAREVFKERRRLGEVRDDGLAVARADGEIGTIEMEEGNYEKALRRFEGMYLTCSDAGDRPGMARALGRIGQIHAARGEEKEAIEKYREALELFTLLGDRRQMAFTEGEIGLIAWNRKDYGEAMDRFEREELIYRQLGDPHGAGMARCKVGLVHLDREDLDRAEECFRDYLEVTLDLGYRRGVGYAQGDLGIVRLRRGDHAAALDLFDQALTTHRDLGFPLGVSLWLKWKAETILHRLRTTTDVDADTIDRAITWAEESARIATTLGKPDAIHEATSIAQEISKFN